VKTVENDLKKLEEFTHAMAVCREESAKIARTRRMLMYRLNRTESVSYAQLSEAANINPARTAVEMRKAREEVSDI
jgi:hypothetical protein